MSWFWVLPKLQLFHLLARGRDLTELKRCQRIDSQWRSVGGEEAVDYHSRGCDRGADLAQGSARARRFQKSAVKLSFGSSRLLSG